MITVLEVKLIIIFFIVHFNVAAIKFMMILDPKTTFITGNYLRITSYYNINVTETKYTILKATVSMFSRVVR